MEKSKIKNFFNNFKFCFVVLTFAFCILNFTGCTTVIESVKGVAGISTKSLEEHRKDAITKTFNSGYSRCFDKAKKVLKNMGAYIYAQDTRKQMIAVYISEEDTTPVGIFFKAIDANTTQIEVSSPSTYGREFMSKRLFQALEKMFNPEEKEEKADVKKDK